MGVARPELSSTARILVEGRYIIIYEPMPFGVLVIAVVHGMRNPRNWL
jgi:toxin ParE1/3/4